MEGNKVMMIEFIERYPMIGDMPHVALFDERDLTEQEALNEIKSRKETGKMIIINKEQFNNVFRSMKEEIQ